jgi:hypothetical protein
MTTTGAERLAACPTSRCGSLTVWRRFSQPWPRRRRGKLRVRCVGHESNAEPAAPPFPQQGCGSWPTDKPGDGYDLILTLHFRGMPRRKAARLDREAAVK